MPTFFLALAWAFVGRASAQDMCSNIGYGVNYGQGFIQVLSLAAPEDCCKACSTNVDCLSWDFDTVGLTCWLKDNATGQKSEQNRASGVKSDPGPGGSPPPPGVAPTASGGLSGGSTFNILLLVAAFVYFGGGSMYNMRYHDASGVEAIPHRERWAELPGLVWDGCVFSRQQVGHAIAWLRKRYASAPTELTQSLAAAGADDDGGPPGTPSMADARHAG